MPGAIQFKSSEHISGQETVVHFHLNDYIGWFEKINLNTLIWQVIVLLLLLYFGTEIKKLIGGLIKKLGQIKSIGEMEFDLSDETKTELEQKSAELSEELQPYKVAFEQDPDMVFLTHFINFEKDLTTLYTRKFNLEGGPILYRTEKLLRELIDAKAIKSGALSIYYDIRQARNKAAHGQKVFENFNDALPYLKSVLLLKDMIQDGLSKLKTQKSKGSE